MSRPDPVVVTPAVLRGLPLPEPGSDKNARGEILVVGGSRSTPGAVLLAGTAALRAGAGKLVLATAASTQPALGVAVPEAGVHGLAETAEGEVSPERATSIVALCSTADAMLVGSGVGGPEAAVALLSRLLPRVDLPVVVDALGSAYLTEHGEGLHHLDGRAVLTVNPRELAHTAGCSEEDATTDPLAPALEVARRSRVVVACGGTEKLVVTPDGAAWVVHGGGPGLGVSGSGDVFAGIVAGLLARGAQPARAAVWGAFVHARAGERLAADTGAVGFLARELPGQVPLVLTEVG